MGAGAALLLVVAACSGAGQDDGARGGLDDAPPRRPPVTRACREARPPAVVDRDVRPVPDLGEPRARVAFQDPVFGTCVVRVTDRRIDVEADDRSGGLKNEYAKAQSFNADGSRILVRGTEGTWYLYDAESLKPLGRARFEGIDPRWDPNDADILYYVDGPKLMAYDIVKRKKSLRHDFATDFPGEKLAAVWTKYEGGPSADGRLWGLMAEDEDWMAVAFLIYDLRQDRIVARRSLAGLPEAQRDVEDVTISPNGDHFLAYYANLCEGADRGSDERPCGLMIYDRDLGNGWSTPHTVGHNDVAYAADGGQVLVHQDTETDHIAMIDLATREATDLVAVDFGHSAVGMHVSGKAYHRPGWALVSTYNGARPSATWMDDSVFAIELKAGGRVVRLAHTRSRFDEKLEERTGEKDYWAEPHASIDVDFTRVLFTTNWGRSGTDEVDMYLIQLPLDWPAALRAPS